MSIGELNAKLTYEGTDTKGSLVLKSLDIEKNVSTAGSTPFTLKGLLSTNVTLGSYATTLYGVLDLKTAGGVTGLGSAVCAELIMPGGAAGIGTFGALELECTCPASWTSSQSVSLIFANISGTTSGKFDDEGYFLNLYGGFNSATGHMLYSHAITSTGAAAGSIRIIVNGTPRFLYFWAAEGAT